MHILYAPFLGLALYTAASVPLSAQEVAHPQAATTAESMKKLNDFTDGLGPDYYIGIPLTEAEQAKLGELRKKQRAESKNLESLEKMKATGKRHADEIYAQLTPAQKKVVDRNLQVRSALGYGGITKMFMGTDLTDEQLSVAKKLLAGQEGTLLDPKMLDASYALLTPEQQKVAAPQYQKLKAEHELEQNRRPAHTEAGIAPTP